MLCVQKVCIIASGVIKSKYSEKEYIQWSNRIKEAVQVLCKKQRNKQMIISQLHHILNHVTWLMFELLVWSYICIMTQLE